jgi:hypothetical protein
MNNPAGQLIPRRHNMPIYFPGTVFSRIVCRGPKLLPLYGPTKSVISSLAAATTTAGPDNTIVVNPHGVLFIGCVCFKNPAPLLPLKVTQVLPVHAECCTVSIQACVYQMNETTTDIAMALTSRPSPPAFTPRLLLFDS